MEVQAVRMVADKGLPAVCRAVPAASKAAEARVPEEVRAAVGVQEAAAADLVAAEAGVRAERAVV